MALKASGVRLAFIALATGFGLALLACGGDGQGQSFDTTADLRSPHEGNAELVVPISDGAPPIEAQLQPPPPPKERKVVILDPGHGGDEVGSARNGVVEKESNLDIAIRVERLLLAQGLDVVLTRREDKRAAPQQAGYTAARSDLQARLDLANAAGGDVFVSIHSNGSEDAGQRGVEAWYDSNRLYAPESHVLASLLVTSTLSELRAFGYSAVDRGLFDGRCFRARAGRCVSLFVIGGARATSREEVMRRGGDPEALGFTGRDVIYSRPADMPAALVELLVITNPGDAAVLRQAAGREALARGVAKAIMAFLQLPFEGS